MPITMLERAFFVTLHALCQLYMVTLLILTHAHLCIVLHILHASVQRAYL